MTFTTDFERWGKKPAEKSQIRLRCSERDGHQVALCTPQHCPQPNWADLDTAGHKTALLPTHLYPSVTPKESRGNTFIQALLEFIPGPLQPHTFLQEQCLSLQAVSTSCLNLPFAGPGFSPPHLSEQPLTRR